MASSIRHKDNPIEPRHAGKPRQRRRASRDSGQRR